jgi:hypothetical protein
MNVFTNMVEERPKVDVDGKERVVRSSRIALYGNKFANTRIATRITQRLLRRHGEAASVAKPRCGPLKSSHNNIVVNV